MASANRQALPPFQPHSNRYYRVADSWISNPRSGFRERVNIWQRSGLKPSPKVWPSCWQPRLINSFHSARISSDVSSAGSNLRGRHFSHLDTIERDITRVYKHSVRILNSEREKEREGEGGRKTSTVWIAQLVRTVTVNEESGFHIYISLSRSFQFFETFDRSLYVYRFLIPLSLQLSSCLWTMLDRRDWLYLSDRSGQDLTNQSIKHPVNGM